MAGITGRNEFAGHVRTLGKFGKLRNFILVLDGDSRNMSEARCRQPPQKYGQYVEPLFLPGDAAPEQWLWDSIRRRPDDYATRLGLTATDLGQKMRNVQRLVEGAVRRSDEPKAAVGALAFDLDRTVPDLARIIGQWGSRSERRARVAGSLDRADQRVETTVTEHQPNRPRVQPTGSEWNWPGARWWRVDLHAHSPASHDFGSETDRDDPDWLAWIAAARDAGLDAIAVTDHNTAAGIAPLQDAASRVENSPVLFPGAEVTASDGVHLIVLFDPDCAGQHVEDFLSRVEIPVDDRGDQTARSSFSVEQILDRCPDGALIVGPHVNQPRGLLELSGQERRAVLRHANLAAVEVVPDCPVDESWIDGSKSEIGRSLPRLWNSDSHALDQVGRRFNWIKMTRPDTGGLRLALLDGDDSVRPTAAGDTIQPEFPCSIGNWKASASIRPSTSGARSR